jgi:hypothetical protein
VVTKAAKCTDRIFYKLLDHGAESWAKALQELKNAGYDRLPNAAAIVAGKGFDIHAEAKKLRDLYLRGKTR